MKVVQVMNNNVCIANDEGKEIVVVGTGIGFKKKVGDDIAEEKIQKRFVLASSVISEKMLSMIEETPSIYFEIVSQIVERAKSVLGKELNEGIYLTLTDHLSFTMERYQRGMSFKNGFLWDVKKLYPDEFQLGMYALSLLHEAMNIELEEDEAAFIAIHIMNAEFNSGVDVMESITKIIHQVMKIVQYYIGHELDEDSVAYFRFINHVKFFAQRVINNTPYEDKENPMLDVVKQNYGNAYACALKIKEFILLEYQRGISDEEIMYLAIHIHRLISS